MSNYKLLPVEPTTSMVHAAMDAAFIQETDAYDVYDAMLAAAPAVQGEPKIEPYDAGSLNDFGGGDVGWWHDYIRSELDRAYEFYLAQLAAAPQPAPPPRQEARAMSDDLEKEIALYEAERNRAWHSWFAARGDVSSSGEHTRIFDGGFRMAWELCRAQPTEQQPAPDVTPLAEALTELCDEIDKHEIHAAISKTSISWFKRKARAALAAYRKRGE